MSRCRRVCGRLIALMVSDSVGSVCLRTARCCVDEGGGPRESDVCNDEPQ